MGLARATEINTRLLCRNVESKVDAGLRLSLIGAFASDSLRSFHSFRFIEGLCCITNPDNRHRHRPSPSRHRRLRRRSSLRQPTVYDPGLRAQPRPRAGPLPQGPQGRRAAACGPPCAPARHGRDVDTAGQARHGCETLVSASSTLEISSPSTTIGPRGAPNSRSTRLRRLLRPADPMTRDAVEDQSSEIGGSSPCFSKSASECGQVATEYLLHHDGCSITMSGKPSRSCLAETCLGRSPQ